ncbi:hypothetical protein PVL29_016199 [Vitis rotundifolia]|uniref:Uncharacterized protein n=1 Tax=Vitis rotundifolia TaxID=103349 RepID=A0AA38ZEY8_VITRO|nr:hypothetical protein PVL29_016199 [Vitis rotundifolia]
MFMTNPVWLFVEIIDFGFLSYQILCSEMLGSLTVVEHASASEWRLSFCWADDQM